METTDPGILYTEGAGGDRLARTKSAAAAGGHPGGKPAAVRSVVREAESAALHGVHRAVVVHRRRHPAGGAPDPAGGRDRGTDRESHACGPVGADRRAWPQPAGAPDHPARRHRHCGAGLRRRRSADRPAAGHRRDCRRNRPWPVAPGRTGAGCECNPLPRRLPGHAADAQSGRSPAVHVRDRRRARRVASARPREDRRGRESLQHRGALHSRRAVVAAPLPQLRTAGCAGPRLRALPRDCDEHHRVSGAGAHARGARPGRDADRHDGAHQRRHRRPRGVDPAGVRRRHHDVHGRGIDPGRDDRVVIGVCAADGLRRAPRARPAARAGEHHGRADQGTHDGGAGGVAVVGARHRTDRDSRAVRRVRRRDDHAVGRGVPADSARAARNGELGAAPAVVLRVHGTADAGRPARRRRGLAGVSRDHRRGDAREGRWDAGGRAVDRSRLARRPDAWGAHEHARPDGADCAERRLRPRHPVAGDVHHDGAHGARDDRDDGAVPDSDRQLAPRARAGGAGWGQVS